MKTILLIHLFSLFYMENNKIIIDVAKTDKVNLSKIAEKVWVVPLATGDEIVDIYKVFLIDNLVYVLEGDPRKETMAQRVLKFDIMGRFLGLFGIKDPITGEYITTRDMWYDRMTGLIYLNNSDGYRVYDKNGNLQDFVPNAQAKFIFNKSFWFHSSSVNDGIGNISLVKRDFKSQKSDTIENFKFEMPEIFNSMGVGVFPPMGLSIRKDELFVSLGTDNTIYKEHNNKLVPAYKFEYINGIPTFFDILRAPRNLLIGHFIKCGYGIKGLSYDFLYDTRSGVSYNIRYTHDNLNRLVSGIKDDINLTGYFRINPTNQENYIYFFKRHEDIKGCKLYDPNQINHLLFLVKLK
jgi:hypothetical protein